MNENRYVIRTQADGKKVKLTIAPNGRIIRTAPVSKRANRTQTGKRLIARRRRISR